MVICFDGRAAIRSSNAAAAHCSLPSGATGPSFASVVTFTAYDATKSSASAITILAS